VSNTKEVAITNRTGIAQAIYDFKLLVKFNLSLLVIFSSVTAFMIASQGNFTFYGALLLSIGGFLVTGAANILNEVLERDYDKLMKRTADRPIAAGRMSVSSGVLLAGLMCLSGVALLSLFNPMTGLLGMISLVTYAFIYTPMKRQTPFSVVVGAVPGALPMMIGCVAAEGGELSMLAITLFSLQFLWQFLHFFPIAWLGHEDYTIAGFKLMPTRSGEPRPIVGLYCVLAAMLLIPLGFVPYYLGISGIVSLVVMVLAALGCAWYGYRFYRECTKEAARRVMFCSLIYLPVVLIAVLLDN
jgi:protoheme IX farnesyltransferase